MKKIFVIILCVLMLMLAGCSNGKYSLSDVKNALSAYSGVTNESPSENLINWYNADGAADIIHAASKDDPDFHNMTVFVFKSSGKAENFFNSYKNEERQYIYLNDSGENFCYLDDYNYCDAYGEIYLYIEDNVVFMCEEVYGCWYSSEDEAQQLNNSNAKRRETYLDFCKNDLPKIADSID